jgi:hypothetical protein
MKKQHDNITFSELLGSSLAIAQHGIDLAFTGLFKRLKQTSTETPAKKSKNTWLKNAGDFTRGFVGFIGKTGDSYMETYSALKKESKE